MSVSPTEGKGIPIALRSERKYPVWNRSKPIVELPEELLLHVISFLNASSLKRLERVSKSFLRLSKGEESSWKQFCQRHFPSSRLFRESWRVNFIALKSIEVENAAKLHAHLLKLRETENIQEMKLRKGKVEVLIEPFSDNLAPEVHLNNLKLLISYHSSLSSVRFASANCTGFNWIPDKFWLDLANAQRRVKHLEFSALEYRLSLENLKIMLATFSRLRSFSLKYDVTPDIVNQICAFKKLRSLELSGYSRSQELRALADLKQLRVFKFNSHRSPPNYFQTEVLKNFLKTLPPLHVFHFRGGHLDDECLSIIAQRCPQLQELLLEDCKNVTEDGISRLKVICPALKSSQLMGRI